MRIERKYVAHFINAKENETPTFVRLGKDLEEFSPKMSAKVDTVRNILGENRIIVSGYDKSAAVETYYAEAGSPLFKFLQNIIDTDQVLDQVKTEVLEVKLWEGAGNDVYPAILEDVYIEVTSYGGDTAGYRIGFNIHYTGIKKHGTYALTDGIFTEGGA